MKYLQRRAGLVLVLALFITPNVLFAQSDDGISVVGSSIAAPLFQAIAEVSGSDIALTVEVTGTTGGFERLCAGDADIVAASRSISTDEDASCAAAGVAYRELLIAHNAAAFVVNPVSAIDCLTPQEVSTIYRPSAEGQVTNWVQVNPGNVDAAFSLAIPETNSPSYAVLDKLTGGAGVRGDASPLSEADIIALISEQPDTLGFVSLQSALSASESVKILQLDSGSGQGCMPASAENIENDLYNAADRLLLYVNSSASAKAGLTDLLTFGGSSAASEIVTAAGFLAPSASAYEANALVLAGETDRPFTRDITNFEIPAGVVGQVNIAGSAAGYSYLNSVTTAFTGVYANVTISIDTQGEVDGFRRLCNGEIDAALSTAAPTEEQADNCAANNIEMLPVTLGNQVIVAVGNAPSGIFECLTTAQFTTAFSAASDDSPATWNTVDTALPELPITLFAPNLGSTTTDTFMLAIGAANNPSRADIQLSDDALYRAAATANVEGALTYMSWQEYQQVLANNQANIQLVAVDSGNGCITPSAETVADGTYPITRLLNLYVNTTSLNKVEVQSVLWFLASDESYGFIEDAELIGVEFVALPALRETLQQAYTAAEEAVALAAEATAELSPEATAEATESAG